MSQEKKTSAKSTMETIDQHLLFVNDIIDFACISVLFPESVFVCW